MKAVALEEPRRFTPIRQEAPPVPGPGEALVRVRRVGVCGTDIHAYHGRQPYFTYPRILGHELGVEVEAVGSGVDEVSPGDTCAVEPYLNCGECIACRRGRPNCCVRLQVLGVHTDGGMREWILVPARKLHRSNRLTLEQLALVETLGIGAHAVARGAIEPGEWALVVGAGPIGLSVTQFLQAAGARVIVMDQSESRLAFCGAHFKPEATVLANDELSERLSELTGGDSPTVVFDATGNPDSMNRSFTLAPNSGRVVLVGLVQSEIRFSDPDFHRKELTVLATRNALPGDFERILRLMEEGRVDTSPWITHRCALDELPGTFDRWLAPDSGLIKGMVEV